MPTEISLENKAVESSLLNYIKKYPTTIILIAANVLIFVLMIFKGGPTTILSPDSKVLISFGSNYGPLTTAGQSFRLVTCGFVHVGLLHLFMNMVVLGQIGMVVERLLGSSRLIGIYFIGLIGASLTSLWLNPLTLSAGASGAILALIGAFGAFIYRRRKFLSKEFLDSFKKSSLVYILYLGLMGTLIPNIDNAAHFGGLFFGFFSGLILSPANSKKEFWTLRDSIGVSFMLFVLFIWWHFVQGNVVNSSKLKGYNAYELAIKDLKNNNYNQAILSLNKAIANGYVDDSVYLARAQTYFLLKAYHKSLQDCNSAVRLNPKSVLAYTIRGFDFYHLGNLDLNIKDLKRVVKLDPNNYGMYELLSLSSLENGAYTDALLAINKAIDLKPGQSAFYDRRGFILGLMGNFKEAYNSLEKSLSMDPANAGAFFHLGVIYLLSNNYQQAKYYFDKSKSLHYSCDEWEATFVNQLIQQYNAHNNAR